MELKRNHQGFVDIGYLLNNKDAKLKDSNSFFDKFCFIIGEDEYFYKRVVEKNLYNELIAEELAKDFGIACAHYDIAVYDGKIGVISKNIFENGDKNFEMKKILNGEDNNNLTDIWDTLLFRYKNEKIVEKLMNEIVDVFMFDVLIGNSDRHTGNLQLVENDNNVKICPLYDNERMLSSDSIKYGIYFMGIERDDYYRDIAFDENRNLLFRFLNMSDNIYKEIFKSKLWIISNENINKVINRVENRINNNIPDYIKEFMKEQFSYNNKCINDVLRRVDEKKAGLI